MFKAGLLKGCSAGSMTLAVVGAVLFGGASAAHAQSDSQAQGPSGTEQNEGTTTGSEDQVRDSGNEIIVTAQFRAESSQEVPLSITALTGDMLGERGFTNITDVARSVPNVTMAQGSGIRSGGQIYIRGIGQNDNNFALEPGVGVYVDDVYYGTTYGAAFDLMDVGRVEILRGPQGTLTGANSIGGAVKMFSVRPEGAGDGFFEVGYGSFNRLDLRGAYDIALTPDLAMRVSGGLRSDNGHVRRLDFACHRPALAANLPRANTKVDDCEIGREGGRNVRAARASLLWEGSSNLEVNVIGDVTVDDSQPGAGVPIAIVGDAASPLWQAEMMRLYGVRLDNRFIPDERYVTYSTYADIPNRGLILDPDSHSVNWGITGIVDLDLSENLSLKSITAYRAVDGEYSGDVDATPLNQNTEYFNQIHKQFTQELRLSGAIGELIDWTVGAFYYDANDLSRGTVDVPNAVPQFGGLYFQQNDPVDNTNYAGFANATARPLDGLEVTGGLRHTWSRKVYTFSRFDPNPNGAIYRLGIDKLGRSAPTEFDRTDVRVALSYDWSRNFRTYASYSTGFKGGGVNPRPSTPAQQTPLGPETLTAYEAGFKSEVLGRRLTLNGAGFINKYKDLQVSARSLDLNGVLATLFTNVGRATIKGIELEAVGEPVDGLEFNAAVGYLDFQYDDLGTAAGLPGGPCLTCVAQFTPEWKWNVGVQYEVDLSAAGVLTPRIDVDYMGKMFSDPSNREVSSIPARTVTNFRLAWRPSDEDTDWQAALYVSNVFDEYYYATVNDYIGSSQVATAQPGRPREVLVTLRRNF